MVYEILVPKTMILHPYDWPGKGKSDMYVPIFLHFRVPNLEMWRKIVEKSFHQKGVSADTFQMRYPCIRIPLPTFTYDSFPKPTTSPPKKTILGRFTKWKIIFSNSFWTKYWGCSWFWISIKSYYCYKSGSRGPLHPL